MVVRRRGIVEMVRRGIVVVVVVRRRGIVVVRRRGTKESSGDTGAQWRVCH